MPGPKIVMDPIWILAILCLKKKILKDYPIQVFSFCRADASIDGFQGLFEGQP